MVKKDIKNKGNRFANIGLQLLSDRYRMLMRIELSTLTKLHVAFPFVPKYIKICQKLSNRAVGAHMLVTSDEKERKKWEKRVFKSPRKHI